MCPCVFLNGDSVEECVRINSLSIDALTIPLSFHKATVFERKKKDKSEMRRIEQMDAADNVKAYLRKVSKESFSIFRNGYISEATSAVNSSAQSDSRYYPPSSATLSAPSPLSFPPRLLPMKKKRRDSSDDEADQPPARHHRSIITNVTPPVEAEDLPCASTQPRVNLAAKWLAMTSFSSLALPTAALPPFDFIEETVQRFAAVRERIAQCKMGVEFLAEVTDAREDNNWKAHARALHQIFGLQGGTVTRRDAIHLVEELSAAISSLGAPSLDARADLRLWHQFLEGTHGPFAFGAPSMSLMCHVDHAHANTMLHAIITKLHRGSRNQLPPQYQLRQRECDHDDISEDSNGDGAETPPEASSGGGKLFINDDQPRSFHGGNATNEHSSLIMDINGSKQYFSAHVTNERSRELLRFLRFLMPCSNNASRSNGTHVKDGDQTPKSRGLGVWWYSAAACVDLLVDPDTDRALHDLFRCVCQHIKTIYEVVTSGEHCDVVVNSKRGALLEHLATAKHLDDVYVKSYWDVSEVDQHDLLALYTLLVLLAKVFHQNQNNLLNL
jgi:hypothetical protein